MEILYIGARTHIEFLRAASVTAGSVDLASCPPSREFIPMIDILLLALGLGFFGLMVLYAAACEKV